MIILLIERSLTNIYLSKDSIFTNYPIVLIHGLFGFSKITDYGYFIESQSLMNKGIKVLTPAISATNTTDEGGEQLLIKVRKF